MGKEKKLGCFASVVIIFFGAGIGYLVAKDIGIVIGVISGIVLAVIANKKPKDRICDICGSPVLHTSYKGEINGKHFNVICGAKCKNHATTKKRKEKMAELLN